MLYKAEVTKCLTSLVLDTESSKQALQIRRLKWQIHHLPIRPTRFLAKLAALYDYPPEVIFDADQQRLVVMG